MRIFIAGAGGTLGFPLLKNLVRNGHSVTGMTRTPSKRQMIEAAGARAVIANALDAEEVARAIKETRPAQVINLLTAIPAAGVQRARDLHATNLLRTTGAANVLTASIDNGVSRLIVESFPGVFGYPAPRRKLTEEDSPGPIPKGDPLSETILALRSLEDRHLEARWQGKIEAVVLRYGLFYGPAVPSTEFVLQSLRKGRMFVPRPAPGVGSWIHIDDAATATVLAIAHPKPAALYQIVDDEPLTVDAALADMSTTMGLRRPRSIPMWIARLAAPAFVRMITARLPLDNRKAKEELNWRPAYPTLASGFAAMAGTASRAA